MRREPDTGPLPMGGRPVRPPVPGAPPTAELAVPARPAVPPAGPVDAPPTVAPPAVEPPTVEARAVDATTVPPSSVDGGPAPDEVPVTEQPVQKPGRAGRNLTAAIGVGVSLAAVIL